MLIKLPHPSDTGPSNRQGPSEHQAAEAREQQLHLDARMAHANAENQLRAGGVPGGDRLWAIPWPSLPHYGYDHGRMCSQLAAYLGQWLGLGGEDLTVLKGAAFLHDLGRAAPHGVADPSHAERGAEAARALLLTDPDWRSQSRVIDRVCAAIARHRLPPLGAPVGSLRPPEGDLVMVALWDADALEGARIAPQTAEGMAVLRGRADQLLTPWAKDAANQRRWRQFRGW